MPKKFREELKEEIKEELADVVYEKVKSEFKQRIKKTYYSLKDSIFSFLGFKETQEQKIRRISEEIKKENDIVLSDTALGMVELFTVRFGNSVLVMLAARSRLKDSNEEAKLEGTVQEVNEEE